MGKIRTICLGYAFSLVTSASLFAESHVGNGAHEVICPNGSMLLDIHEGSFDPNFVIDLGAETDSYRDKIELVSRKLQRLDPTLFNHFSRHLHFVMQSSTTNTGGPRPTNDHGEYLLAPNCQIRQLVTQTWTGGGLTEREFVFSPSWRLYLDTLSQAATLIHEAFYALALENGHVTSENTRKFVRFLISNQPSKISLSDYQELRDVLGFNPNGHILKGFFAAIYSSSNEGLCEKSFLKAEISAKQWCQEQNSEATLSVYSKKIVANFIDYKNKYLWVCNVKSYYICRF